MGKGVPVKVWLALGVLLMMAGCGNDPVRVDSAALIKGALQKAVVGKSAAPAAPPLNRAAIDQQGLPLTRAALPKSGAVAVLALIGANNGAQTWGTADGITLVLRNGVALATRGLGTDLMSASAPYAATLASGASHDRRHYYLFGGEKEIENTFACTMSSLGREAISIVGLGYAVQHRQEHCTGPSGTFTNDFWFDTLGKIRQSRQWISPPVGYMELQDLMR